ncbi:MAG: hybrid sensor histidine kinase/response regulator, partial [Planctomycetota bacterium]
SILGYGHLARRRCEDLQTQQYLDTIIDAGNRAAGLVCQILDFSRQGDHHPQPIAVDPMIGEVARFLRSTLPASVQLALDLEAGDARVMADATALHEILMNLAGNAVYAMQEHGGLLLLRSRRDPLGEQVVIVVSDTGCGIPRSVRERIFEPYFTTKPVGQGTGMGLAVVHGLVHRMGGEIVVEDNTVDGRGTVFRIALPRHLATDGAQTEPEAPLAPATAEVIARGGRVLFVDDEPLLVELARVRFGAAGVEAYCTSDPRQAHARLLEDPDAWDCVVTDQSMPHCTGVQLAREIKILRPDLPVLLCSGLQDGSWRADDGWHEVDEVLGKPYDFDHLLSRMQGWLR